MVFIVSVLYILGVFQDIPLKPLEEFEVKLDYEFRERPPRASGEVVFGAQPVASRTGRPTVLPWVSLRVKLHALPGEKVRMRVTGNPPHGRSFTRRVSPGDTYTLDLGYVADVVDRVAPHAYTLTFYDDDRNPVDCIRISVEADGSFIVNGEKRGAF